MKAWLLPSVAPLVRSHPHYCAACDRRWICRADPCLRFYAAPCPDRAHPAPPEKEPA